jgi:hypothetical protein
MIIKPELIRKPTRREFLKYAGVGALAFGVPLLLPKRAHAAYDVGFDFRATAGYVTDPTDCTYVLASDTSPTTRGGATFNWDAQYLESRDRTTSGDTRLSGQNICGGIGTNTWTLTLPSTGDYDIYAAFGDAGNQQCINATISDNATAFITITNVLTGNSDEYIDAAGTARTRAAWIAASARGGTAVRRTFASTSLVLKLNVPSSLGCPIAHLFVSQVSGGGGGSVPVRHRVTNF